MTAIEVPPEEKKKMLCEHRLVGVSTRYVICAYCGKEWKAGCIPSSLIRKIGSGEIKTRKIFGYPEGIVFKVKNERSA